MLCLMEGTGKRLHLALHVAQMEEMNSLAQPVHHAGQVVVRPDAERSGAQRDSVCRTVDRLHDCGIVGFRRHDARQAEKRKGRIVRMAAEPHA